jgi:hypothetical protein
MPAERPDRLEGFPERRRTPGLRALGAASADRRATLLRLYGSEAVLGRFLRDASRRLHLLNYGGRPIEGLRVRLLWSWAQPEALVFGEGRAAVEDYVTGAGATEFSLGTLGAYAVVDRRAAN